jgi:PhnB protein
MKTTLSPYLNFMGQTREAMEFYHAVLGGELTMQTYGESGQSKDESEKELVMHAVLKTDDLMFMAADGNKEHQVHMGDNIQMSLGGSDEEALTKYFNGLAEGGKVTMPLAKQFWGDTFGMLIDKFGVHWMVNISSGEQK